MLPLNYHHLYYFWIVAREGGISHASETLDVSSSTISAQISQLEATHGVKLFHRVGRNLRLSEVGLHVLRFDYGGTDFYRSSGITVSLFREF